MGRRLGQHFLTDTTILDRIVAALEPAETDIVVEIGPGRGSLTRRLAPRVRGVVAVEKDERLARGEGRGAKREQSTTPDPWPPNVTVLHADALELDWHAASRSSPFSLLSSPFSPFKVIGNIPYYITSPLIEKALSSRAAVTVFLVQQEVADRLASAPGGKTYGALSVGVQAVARVERLFTVKAGAFSPPPKVDSAVVRLTPLERPPVAPGEQAAFRTFTVALFGQRRKQLARSLREVAEVDAERAERSIVAAGLNPTDRVEVAPVAKLIALYRIVSR